MEFKGTPGPWLRMNGTDVFTGLNSINASGIKSDKTDGWQIADCSVGKTFVDGEYVELSTSEQIANARLIAAAPELLEQLIRLRNKIAGYHLDDSDHLDVVDAAINKALGRE